LARSSEDSGNHCIVSCELSYEAVDVAWEIGQDAGQGVGIEIGVVGLGPAVIPANRDESTSLVGRIPLRADERLGTSWVNGLPRDGSGLGVGS